MKRPRVLVGLALLILALTSCAREEAEPAARERILLISIDTLRADALGAYGRAEARTPNLDAFAREGTRARHCIAPLPLTFPSHASMLTGLHPLSHGVLYNADWRLSEEVPTFAELLKANAWTTGAIVASGPLHRRHGLARGFDEYHDDLHESLPASKANPRGEAPADVVSDVAIEWLQGRREDEAFFLFVHYIDPHDPYTPPSPWAEESSDPYLGEVAFADAQVGRLLAALDERGWRESTLVIVTSDHGEGLGAHDVDTHGHFLYDEVLRVPFLLRGPGVEPGRVIEETASLLDLVPTLRAWIGLPPDPALSGHSLFEPLPRDRWVMAVSYVQAFFFDWSPLWVAWAGDDKLIKSSNPEYYRLDEDPAEEHNVAALHPERAAALEAALDTRAREHLARRYAAVSAYFDDSIQQQLAALGYVASAGIESGELDEATLFDFSGADPKQHTQTLREINAYLRHRADGELEAARERLERVRELDPGNPILHKEHPRLLAMMGAHEEVLAWFAQQTPEVQARSEPRQSAARALVGLDRGDEAIAMLRESLERDPSHLPSRFDLARQLVASGRRDEGLREYELLLEQDPSNPSARNNYASLLASAGRTDAAVAELERLIAQSPRYARPRRNLGMLYARQERAEEAIEQLERYVQLAPAARDRRPIEMAIMRLKSQADDDTP